ncbi:MAG: hypothetical protein HY610_03880, partial [Elusimicrobia bacterium]|nr:hypothetical protein [Elusimicrobiota bacterium]
SMVSQGKKMGGMDDDALPFTRVYDRARYFQLLSQRESQVQGHLGELYRSLGAILGRDVLSETSFYRLIGEMESAPERFDGASLEEARQLLEHYFAYDPDGDGGVVPRVAGQIVPRGVEKRLRFDDMVEEGLPNSLVTVEDTATTSHDQLPSIQDQNYVSIPVDVWGVFAETMESPIGSPLGGHLFTRDRRGIAGVPAQEIPDGTVMAVAGHFGGDRDLNALALIREAVRMWREEGGVNLRYLQQVVKKAIFVDLKGSVSTLMHNANQFCFNMTSVDNSHFSIPTTGGWLRVEEPFQASLFKFLFGKYMAWARVAGGHDRLPGARRPNLPKQSLWETMALALYKDLERILSDQMLKLSGVTDPAERIRSLGQAYLELAQGEYSLRPEQKEILRNARREAEKLANDLLQNAQSLDQQAKSSGDDDASKRLDTEAKQLDDLAKELAQQFHLKFVRFKIDKKGAITYRVTGFPVAGSRWENGNLKEFFNEENDHYPPSWGVMHHRIDRVENLPLELREILPEFELSPGTEREFAYISRSGLIEESYFQRTREIIRQQILIDGRQLLIWPDILQAGFDSLLNHSDHPLSPPLSIRPDLGAPDLEERGLNAENYPDLYSAVRDLYHRQIRAGHQDKGEWKSFFTIIENGETVRYAVFLHGEILPRICLGEVPQEIQKKADFVFVQNIARSRRPGRPGGQQERISDTDPKMLILRSEKILEKNPDEYVLEWPAPSGHTWWFLYNPYPIFPPLEGYPAERQLHHLTVARADSHVPQTEMSHVENVRDALALLCEINQSELLEKKDQVKFRLGINGWYTSEAADAPKGGASQNQAHLQLIRYTFPVERLTLQSRGAIGAVKISSIQDPNSRGIVLESSLSERESLALLTAETLRIIASAGHSYNVLAAPSSKGDLRVYIFDRVGGTPSDFTNEWAFMELGRVAIVDDPRLFYAMSKDQRDRFGAMTEDEREQWVQINLKDGTIGPLDPDLFNKGIRSLSQLVASQIEVEGTIAELLRSDTAGQVSLLSLSRSFQRTLEEFRTEIRISESDVAGVVSRMMRAEVVRLARILPLVRTLMSGEERVFSKYAQRLLVILGAAQGLGSSPISKKDVLSFLSASFPETVLEGVLAGFWWNDGRRVGQSLSKSALVDISSLNPFLAKGNVPNRNVALTLDISAGEQFLEAHVNTISNALRKSGDNHLYLTFISNNLLLETQEIQRIL